MGLSSKEAHIALFDEEQCKQLIEEVKTYRKLEALKNR